MAELEEALADIDEAGALYLEDLRAAGEPELTTDDEVSVAVVAELIEVLGERAPARSPGYRAESGTRSGGPCLVPANTSAEVRPGPVSRQADPAHSVVQ
jgi:hypothetical protein